MPQKLIVLILALLLGLQPVTTDLYLPALPAITQGFGAGMGQAQLTLTALLLAFGLSQLVWGPLSDRFGRRPILLWGMAAYTASSVACALAPSMAWLNSSMKMSIALPLLGKPGTTSRAPAKANFSSAA